MAILTLERVPNQALSATIGGRRFDLRIFDLGSGMAVDVTINGVAVVRSQRLVAGAPFLPYRYQEAGNLILVTDGSEPDWRQFGTTQALVTLDDAGDPVSAIVPGGSGGGSGPTPPPPSGAYLEKAKNLSDLANVAQALVNLGVYSQAQVDALLDGLLVAADNLSDLTDDAAARANLGVYGTATVDLLLADRLAKAANLSDLADVVAARANLGVYSTTAVDALLAALAATVPDKATGAELRALSNDAKFITPRTVSLAANLVPLVDAPFIDIDFATGINFTVTLAGNRTLGAPSNAKPGMSGTILIKQDATGSRTLAYNTAWKPFGSTPALSTAASAVDLLTWIVEDTGKVRFTLAKGGAA